MISPWSRLPSDRLPAVADLDHDNDQFAITDFVKDSVISLTNAVPFLAGELLAADRMGIFREGLHTLEDAGDIGGGDRPQILGDRLLEDQPIACHGP